MSSSELKLLSSICDGIPKDEMAHPKVQNKRSKESHNTGWNDLTSPRLLVGPVDTQIVLG